MSYSSHWNFDRCSFSSYMASRYHLTAQTDRICQFGRRHDDPYWSPLTIRNNNSFSYSELVPAGWRGERWSLKNPPPRIWPPGQFKERNLADFATKNTVICLHLFKTDQTIYEKDPTNWGIRKIPERPRVGEGHPGDQWHGGEGSGYRPQVNAHWKNEVWRPTLHSTLLLRIQNYSAFSVS